MFKDDDGEDENAFGVTRYPCMPSLVALQQMRNRLQLASLGKKLMKWTAMATGTELRNLAVHIDEIYQSFSQDMRDAFIALARCRYFYPNLNRMVIEGCPNVAEVVFTTTTRTTSGVKIFNYHIIENNTHPYEHLGIEKGGQTIQETKRIWLELLKRMILMIELRNNFKLVEDMHNTANKKWNVLSKVIVPRIKLSMRYILSELEEIEREDNFRLKRFKELKLKKQMKGLQPKADINKIKEENVEEHKEIEKVESIQSAKSGQSALSAQNEKSAQSVRNTENSEHKLSGVSRTIIKKEENLEKITIEQVDKGIKVEKIQRRVTIEAELSSNLINVQELETNDNKDNVELITEAVKYEEEEEQSDDYIGDYCSCLQFFPSLEKVNECESLVKDTSETLEQKVKDALLHTKEIFDLVSQNEEKPPCDNNCLSTWTELKSVLEEIVLDRICDKCKKKIKRSDEDDAPSPQNLSKSSKELSKLSIPGSIFSIKPENENKLGNYERNYKESIKVLRLQNEDGTIRQERKIITVRTDKRNPMKATPLGGENNICSKVISKCSFYDCGGKSDNSQTQYQHEHQEFDTDRNNDLRKQDSLSRPTCTKSEPVCGNRQWNDPKVRSCMSAGSVKETMKLESVNCSCLGDITVNLNFQNKSSEKLHNINIRKLPLVSSINVNFCNFSESIPEESQDDNNLCSCSKQKNETSNVTESTPKANNDSECLCELGDMFEETIDKCCQTFNQIGAELDAMVKNTCSCVTKSNNQEDEICKNASLQSQDFTYIFSKVEKVSLDDSVNTEDCCNKTPEKTFINQHCTYSCMFAYIFSSFKRIEIDNMLKNACSYAPEFPYVFSKLLRETFDNSCWPCNSKTSDIGAMFNDACKRTYSYTYIFSHLKDIKINAMFQSSCKKKDNFPYIFSKVKNENQIYLNNDINKTKAEIEKIFKSARKRLSDFAYLFNHLNTVKIDNMIKEACLQSLNFPYVFSKVDNKTSCNCETKNNSMKIDQMFKDSCKQWDNFPYILSQVEVPISNDTLKVSCKNVEKNIDNFPYIFKEVSKESNVNKDERNTMFTDTCSCKIEMNFNKEEQMKSNQNLCQENDKTCEENNNIINLCQGTNNENGKFQYVYKNEILKEGVKDTFSNIMYAFTKLSNNSTSTSTDIFNYNDIEIMFNQACKHKSEQHFENSNKSLLRASDTKLQSIKKFLELSCKCIANPKSLSMKGNINNSISTYSCREFAKSDVNKSDDNTEKQISNRFTGPVKFSNIDNLFEESCTTKNNFTYVVSRTYLTEIKSCELARRTSDLRQKEIAMIKFANKGDSEVKKLIKTETSDSNQLLKNNDCFNINTIFTDACKRKNEFTYVITGLKQKKSIQLARRTSDLRLKEISMFKDFNKSQIETTIQPKLNKVTNLPCTSTNAMEFIQFNTPTYQEIDEPYSEFSLSRGYTFEIKDKTSEVTFDREKCLKKQEIDKLITDSCTVCVNPKNNYIFQKVLESEPKVITKCNCLSKRKIEFQPKSCASRTSLLINDEFSSLSCIHSQSTSSLTYKNAPKNFLIQIPSNMEDSGHLGVEVMWRTACINGNEFDTEQKYPDFTSATDAESSCKSDSIRQHSQYSVKSAEVTNDRANEHDNISLIRRMLESVKNVYVPFMKPAKSKVSSKVCYSKTDNAKNLLSNSSTSTYSWKSCVMKTCQAEADAESIERKLSYSHFSFGSSLNLATYKNKTASSITSDAEDTDKKPHCSHYDDTLGTGKHTSFGVRIKSVTSVYSTDSDISKKYSHIFKTISSDDSKTCNKCKCSSEARTKIAPSSTRGECSHFLDAQNKHTCDLGNKREPQRSSRYQSVISLRGTCSFTPVATFKRVREFKADCPCKSTNQKIHFDSKWNGCCGGLEQFKIKKAKSALKKSRSYDENQCCCSKSSYL